MSMIKKIPLSPKKDKRGFSWFPFNDFPSLKNKTLLNFHIAELKPGAIRGNHYHPSHREYFFLCGSHLRLYAEDLEGRKEEEIYTVTPDFLFIVPPKIKHLIENIGLETIYFVGFLEGKGEIKAIR